MRWLIGCWVEREPEYFFQRRSTRPPSGPATIPASSSRALALGCQAGRSTGPLTWWGMGPRGRASRAGSRAGRRAGSRAGSGEGGGAGSRAGRQGVFGLWQSGRHAVGGSFLRGWEECGLKGMKWCMRRSRVSRWRRRGRRRRRKHMRGRRGAATGIGMVSEADDAPFLCLSIGKGIHGRKGRVRSSRGRRRHAQVLTWRAVGT